MTVMDVRGFGRQKGDTSANGSSSEDDTIRFLPKLKLEILVKDWDVQRAMVVIADILAEQGESLASQLRAQGLKARYRQLDVRLEASWADLVDDVRRSEGRLDVLVNNAAVTHRAGSVNTSVHDWERVIGVNLTGSYLGIRSCAPLMRESGASSIINFASVAGLAG